MTVDRLSSVHLCFEKQRMREWTVECSELVQLIRSIKVEINIWTFFWRVCGNGKFSLKL